jgi:hypothetical protein
MTAWSLSINGRRRAGKEVEKKKERVQRIPGKQKR